LRLLRAVYFSCSTDLTPNGTARRVAYSDGKYLGWLARTRTGFPFQGLEVALTIRALFSPKRNDGTGS
jgi:hypothetical protein